MTFQDFQNTLNSVLLKRGPLLLRTAQDKFREDLDIKMHAQLESQIETYETKKGGKLKNYDEKAKNRTEKALTKIIDDHMYAFARKYDKVLAGIVDDLEERFLLQMYDNNNQPLEINKDLDKDLDDLLAMVFDSEVEEKQQEVFEEYQQKALAKAANYAKKKVLKAVIKPKPGLKTTE